MKGHRALAASLAAEDVTVVFGLLGDGNMELVVDLVEDHGVRFVASRHEAGAVAMPTATRGPPAGRVSARSRTDPV